MKNLKKVNIIVSLALGCLFSSYAHTAEKLDFKLINAKMDTVMEAVLSKRPAFEALSLRFDPAGTDLSNNILRVFKLDAKASLKEEPLKILISLEGSYGLLAGTKVRKFAFTHEIISSDPSVLERYEKHFNQTKKSTPAQFSKGKIRSTVFRKDNGVTFIFETHFNAESEIPADIFRTLEKMISKIEEMEEPNPSVLQWFNRITDSLQALAKIRGMT